MQVTDPRWSFHNIVSVPSSFDVSIDKINILVNPQIYVTNKLVFRSMFVATGCLLIRQPVISEEFEIGDIGFVRGEDIGFCRKVMGKGHQIFCLTNHIVKHVCEFYKDPLIPELNENRTISIDRQVLHGLVDFKNRGIVLASYPDKKT